MTPFSKHEYIYYMVTSGDISANNYGRGHMKPSHQVSYDETTSL